MSQFSDLREVDRQRVWEGIHARMVHGDRMTFGVVELDPGALAAEHAHPHEQHGLILDGSITFRIGDETKELGPGDLYVVPGDVPHEATAGPDGTVLVDVFTPIREEWRAAETVERSEPRWPGR